jgi:hypothetical protein
MDMLFETMRAAAAVPGTSHVDAVLMPEPGKYDVPPDDFRALLQHAVAACNGQHDATRCVRKYVADAELFTDIDGSRAPRAERGQLLARHNAPPWNVAAWKRDKVHPLQFPCVGPYDHECCCETASFRLGGGWRLVFEAQCAATRSHPKMNRTHRVMLRWTSAHGVFAVPTGRTARALEQVFLATPRWSCSPACG